MSNNLPLETTLAQHPPQVEYLVRDCAHQVQLVLDRYKSPLVVAQALELVEAERQDSIRY